MVAPIVFLSCLMTVQCPAAGEITPPNEPEVFGKLYSCKPGPWGDLEYYYIYLEAPDSLVAHFPAPNTVIKWVFPDASEAGVRTLFDTAGLSPVLRDYLRGRRTESTRHLAEKAMVLIFPSELLGHVVWPILVTKSIVRTEVNGEPATVVYIDDNFNLTSQEAATAVKVMFDNGDVLIGRFDGHDAQRPA